MKISKKDKWTSIKVCTKEVKGACYIKANGIKGIELKETPPNDVEVNVYVVFEIFRLMEKDDINQTLTSRLKMKTFWSDPRLKTNFSHENRIDTVYDHINIRYRMPVIGQDIRERIKIWLPDYDLDNQLMVAPVSRN